MKPVMSEMRTAVMGALIVTLGPLSLALYTPAMPMLVDAFHTTPSVVKLTLSVYFFGFAFSQLACGPLSDAYGRRPVALGFFAIYVLGGVLAALAWSIDTLLAGRLLQGIGAAAGIAISRAMVRDQFTGQNSARILNLIGLFLAVAPAVAPTLGGLILGAFGWQAIFYGMTIYGLVVLLFYAGTVAETNRARHPENARPGRVLRNYGILLSDSVFMRAGLVLGLTLGGTYTLAALLPFVMIETVGLTPTQFGMAMLLQTGSYTTGAAVTGRLLRRLDAQRLIPVGLAFVLAGAAGYAIGLRLLPPTLATVMAPAALWAFGVALVLPGTTSSALAGFPAIAGAASALAGFLQIGGGLAGSAVAAMLFANPFDALTTIIPVMAVTATVAHTLLGAHQRRRAGQPALPDLEVALDPAAVLGASGEEIEAALARQHDRRAAEAAAGPDRHRSRP